MATWRPPSCPGVHGWKLCIFWTVCGFKSRWSTMDRWPPPSWLWRWSSSKALCIFDERPSLPVTSELLLRCYAAAASLPFGAVHQSVSVVQRFCVPGGLETGKCWNLEPTNNGGCADDGMIRRWQREGQRCCRRQCG